jgi:hypothetical protein
MRPRTDWAHIAPKHWNLISVDMANAVLSVARVIHDARNDLETWITSEAVPSRGEWSGAHPTLEDIVEGLADVQDLPFVFQYDGRFHYYKDVREGIFSCRVSEPVHGGAVETIIETGCGWSAIVGMVDSEGFCEVRGNLERADSYWREAWAAIGLPAPMEPIMEPGEGESLRWYSRGYGHLVGPVQMSLLLEYRRSEQREAMQVHGGR